MFLVDYGVILITLLLYEAINDLVMKNWLRDLPLHFIWFRDRLSDKLLADWIQVTLLTALSFLGYQWLNWDLIDFHGSVKNFIFFVTILLTWKSVTSDYDIAVDNNMNCERIMLIVTTFGIYYYPGLILPYLSILINIFSAWTHHAMMPIRILKMFAAYLGTRILFEQFALNWQVSFNITLLPFLLLMLCVQASHYLIPGIGKLQLGEEWYSWLLENDTHYLVISAYNWGWLQFLPETVAIRAVNILKLFNKPINFYTLLFEVGFIFLVVNSFLCNILLIGCSLLNLGIFLTTGILFWEYIVTNIFIIQLIQSLDKQTLSELFSLYNWVIFLAILLFFPVNGKIWSPYSMAWWDTPFTGKVHWRVIGESGESYGLYNNFMCPYETLYGRTYGYFLVNYKIIHDHLGIVWKSKHIRDQIISSKGDIEMLNQLKNQFGVSYRDHEKELQHERYLVSFFSNLNAGKRKNVLPNWLKWLKAPGGQFFYWGDYPSYNRQEPISRVVISYKEKYFDGNEIKTLVDEVIKIVNIN